MKRLNITYPKILVVGSLVGLIAAFWQMVERVHMLKNPADPLSCNINPVVDCGSVLGDSMASVFGPPNALIGVVAFSLLLAFGLQRLNKGTWTNLVRKIVVALGIIMFLFSLWFYWASVYVIGKICIFCIFIWATSIPIGIYSTKDYLENMKNPKGIIKWKRDFIAKNHVALLVAIYLIMIGLFFVQFSDYYFG